MNNNIMIDVDLYDELKRIIIECGHKDMLLVCGTSLKHLAIKDHIEKLNDVIRIHMFNDFKPNPDYESVCKGVEKLHSENCSCILAVGGGSAIDVAKCIKLFSNMDSNANYLQQRIVPNSITLIAVPTTAGTGSESTKYAVIYYDHEKQSVTHDSCIPEYVFLIPQLLETLPIYQKKATMLDALCHSIESYWSVNSTLESKEISGKALRLILGNIDGYLSNEPEGNKNMMIAANLAGQAINITQTTAGHAMCYKITSMFDLAHGHAAALCLPVIWKYMIEHMDNICDSRGRNYLSSVFSDLAQIIGAESCEQAPLLVEGILDKLELIPHISLDAKSLDILSSSVNATRLKNSPVKLGIDDIRYIYTEVFGDRMKG